jgi:hypothetical protein
MQSTWLRPVTLQSSITTSSWYPIGLVRAFRGRGLGQARAFIGRDCTSSKSCIKWRYIFLHALRFGYFQVPNRPTPLPVDFATRDSRGTLMDIFGWSERYGAFMTSAPPSASFQTCDWFKFPRATISGQIRGWTNLEDVQVPAHSIFGSPETRVCNSHHSRLACLFWDSKPITVVSPTRFRVVGRTDPAKAGGWVDDEVAPTVSASEDKYREAIVRSLEVLINMYMCEIIDAIHEKSTQFSHGPPMEASWLWRCPGSKPVQTPGSIR